MLAVDYEALDPGIRETVRHLNAHGFRTTDSGDGFTKLASGKYDINALVPMPHVVCAVTRDGLFTEADRLATLLGADWCVEASYSPGDGCTVLLATRPRVG